ncbi:hypothetical protein HQ520_13305 [bacterium]|nr:hypothetical protein [bacterium]
MNQAIYDHLVQVAKKRDLTTYSDIAPMAGLSMDDPSDRQSMSDLLEEIARYEQQQGNPMLTAVVIHSGGDNNPGNGFFDIAEEFGRFSGSTDQLKRIAFWAEAVTEVYEFWK